MIEKESPGTVGAVAGANGTGKWFDKDTYIFLFLIINFHYSIDLWKM